MKRDNQQLQSGLAQMNLTLSEKKQSQLFDYLRLLQKWNKAYNLTAITDFEKMIAYHLLDSLSVAPYISGENIVDVGSGAGLPGIPLAVYFPDKKFTLIDSIGKKTRFIAQAARELKLANVTVLQTRAEEYPTKNAFDTMIARAVAAIDDLIDISRHLLRPDGKLLMMKSDVPDSSQFHVVKLTVPGVEGQRSLVII